MLGVANNKMENFEIYDKLGNRIIIDPRTKLKLNHDHAAQNVLELYVLGVYDNCASICLTKNDVKNFIKFLKEWIKNQK